MNETHSQMKAGNVLVQNESLREETILQKKKKSGRDTEMLLAG